MNQTCGIYRWCFVKDDKILAVYIGQSLTVKNRKSYHLSKLKRNSHTNPYFQRLFNKYGISSLRWKVIEYCSANELTAREQHWFNHYSKTYTMINLRDFTNSPFNGRHHSEESKKKISEGNKGKKEKGFSGKSHSDETILKMKKSHAGNQANKGHCKVPPDEVKMIRHLKSKGKTFKELGKLYPYSKPTFRRIINYEAPYDRQEG